MQNFHYETCEDIYIKLYDIYISYAGTNNGIKLKFPINNTARNQTKAYFCSVWPVRSSLFSFKSLFPNNLFWFPMVYLARILMQGGMLEPILHLNNGTSGHPIQFCFVV